jgi:hypothetical protein
MSAALRSPLTPALSRKRERGNSGKLERGTAAKGEGNSGKRERESSG